jgi:hypothetical protein
VIRKIRTTFLEHRSLTLEEWEHGFRCDWNPDPEIAIWSHAADVYAEFTRGVDSAAKRKDFSMPCDMHELRPSPCLANLFSGRDEPSRSPNGVCPVLQPTIGRIKIKLAYPGAGRGCAFSTARP